MGLKTETSNEFDLSKKIKIDYDYDRISIPADILKKVKEKTVLIEKEIKKYGPGVFTKFRAKDKKDKDAKNLVEAISIPYKTLCFYAYYFKDTFNFNQFEKKFEKVRKELEKISKRSKTFEKAFNDNKIEYNKNNAVITVTSNPEKDGLQPILPNKIFKESCKEIIEKSFCTYEKAHDIFVKGKEELRNDASKINKASYNTLKANLKNLKDLFKLKLNKIPNEIDDILKKIEKRTILQTKKFTSNVLPQIYKSNNEFETRMKDVNQIINKLSSYKYGVYYDSIREGNNYVDGIYYETYFLYKQLTQGQTFYKDVKLNLEKLKKQSENTEIQETLEGIIKKLKDDQSSKDQIKSKKSEKISEDIRNYTSTLTDTYNKLDEAIKQVKSEFKAYKENYSAKSWAKWIGSTIFVLIAVKLGVANKAFECLKPILTSMLPV